MIAQPTRLPLQLSPRRCAPYSFSRAYRCGGTRVACEIYNRVAREESELRRARGTIIRDAARPPSEVNGTVHLQPRWPLLSKYQVPPPRFTISARQWILFAGIASVKVTAAAIITPQRIPPRKTGLIYSFRSNQSVIEARYQIGPAFRD
jgi:hypothetical protein